MKRPPLYAITSILLAGLMSGCAHYHRFKPTATEYAGIDGKGKGDMTDAAVVWYASDARDILRKRFHVSRVAREVAATAQVGLAAGAGLAGAFHAAATTIAVLGAGSAAIPQFSEIFDAKSRAIGFQQAAAKISEAESAYFKARAGKNPVVSSVTLSIEGGLLFEAINGALESAELVQAGLLPSLEQIKKTEAIALKNLAAARMPAQARSDRLVEDGSVAPRADSGGAELDEKRLLASLQRTARDTAKVETEVFNKKERDAKSESDAKKTTAEWTREIRSVKHSDKLSETQKASIGKELITKANGLGATTADLTQDLDGAAGAYDRLKAADKKQEMLTRIIELGNTPPANP
jgi:hypothetical protein